jgi:hypothetical protein
MILALGAFVSFVKVSIDTILNLHFGIL